MVFEIGPLLHYSLDRDGAFEIDGHDKCGKST